MEYQYPNMHPKFYQGMAESFTNEGIEIFEEIALDPEGMWQVAMGFPEPGGPAA